MKRQRKLSYSQLRVLHNIACGYAPNMHITGMSAHGGFQQTLSSLEGRVLIVLTSRRTEEELKFWHALTMAGIKAHRKDCCKMGRTEDDELVSEVEDALSGDLRTISFDTEASDGDELFITE